MLPVNMKVYQRLPIIFISAKQALRYQTGQLLRGAIH
ncbi:Uncharacterised protein [Yersinia intermedia]|uniref:Uncharacterized protein n=1 Tax=Yersinia intermedia TaxID=631 RepID=A0A0T9MST4_YERIN|nr:Uncharacterised protein [Yersinia intermedia]